MTAQLTKAIWARSQQRGAALLRLLALASYANRQGLAWPKLATLARRTALEPFRLKQRLEEPLELRAAQLLAWLSQRSRRQAERLRLGGELKPLHHRLSAQPRERQQRWRLHERLRHRFRLPRLSLFTVELPDGGSDR